MYLALISFFQANSTMDPLSSALIRQLKISNKKWLFELQCVCIISYTNIESDRDNHVDPVCVWGRRGTVRVAD